MEKRNLERISELTQISKQRELTAEEQAERQELRQNYLKAFKSQFRAQLDNTVVQYPDGSQTSLREAAKKSK